MTAATHLGFLADIIEHPEADDLRLIYADWLQDHGDDGDADHARLIRDEGLWADLTITSGDHGYYLAVHDGSGVAWPSTMARIRRVLFGSDGYVRELPPGLHNSMRLTFRRGWIAEVRCPCAAWRDHGPALVASHPVEAVRLVDVAVTRDDNPLRETYQTKHSPPYSWPWQLEKYGALMDRGGFHADTVQGVEAALSCACLLWARAEARGRKLGVWAE